MAGDERIVIPSSRIGMDPDRHFREIIPRGELHVQEFHSEDFPHVVVAATACDRGHPTAFVLRATEIEVEMIRAEWTSVVHWYAGRDYNSLRELT